MKRIALFALILFGIGLSTTISAFDKPEIKAAPGCPGNVVNATPCPVTVCLTYADCFGVPQTVCLTVPPGATPYSAFTSGCCSAIKGVSVQGIPPAAPPSPLITVGMIAPYVTGNPPPCDRFIVDFNSGLPDCIIRP